MTVILYGNNGQNNKDFKDSKIQDSKILFPLVPSGICRKEKKKKKKRKKKKKKKKHEEKT